MTTATIDAGLDAARHAMVASQLRTNAVSDTRVIAAMSAVPREAFLPVGLGVLAYRDRPLPLGGRREQNSPLATARLLTAAGIATDERILLIGAAGGYTAALIAALAASVVAVECDPALLAIARAASGPEIALIGGDLAQGHPAGAPYDAIVVDGAVEQLPAALVDQVKVGGRIVAGVVERGVTRLAAGERTAGGFALVAFADVDCVILPGFDRPRPFHFPG